LIASLKNKTPAIKISVANISFSNMLNSTTLFHPYFFLFNQDNYLYLSSKKLNNVIEIISLCKF
jgi:hypothetical protein